MLRKSGGDGNPPGLRGLLTQPHAQILGFSSRAGALNFLFPAWTPLSQPAWPSLSPSSSWPIATPGASSPGFFSASVQGHWGLPECSWLGALVTRGGVKGFWMKDRG